MTQRHVTTRDLLRNFRVLKDLLLQGKVQHLVVDVGADRQLEVSVRKGSNAASEIAERFRGLRKPVRIERGGLMETLLEPRSPRR
jgi:hypothetical protein